MLLEARESSIMIQAWWKGILARRQLPKYRKERQEREVRVLTCIQIIKEAFISPANA